MWDVTTEADSHKSVRGFLLTHPVWDVTGHGLHLYYLFEISTHTSRVGCDRKLLEEQLNLKISTHTSRVGCDEIGDTDTEALINFYSHIPCGM